MKTSKVLLSSFVLAGLVSACTNEEIMDVAQNDATVAERTQVNLTFGDIDSRMTAGIDGMTPDFTKNDELGAVLVDAGYNALAWNKVDWTVVDGHVGNNKWSYDFDNKKFTTDGTTAVGAWLFYTKYNEAMTTSRDGVKFAFPQIQEGAVDLAWAENNNINFKITPILKIDGYEGENMNLALQYASVYNYLKLDFKFADEAVNSVQKVIVEAKKGESAPNYEFPSLYRVKNVNVPVANLSLSTAAGAPTVSDWYDDDELTLEDQNAEIIGAYNKIRQRGRYTETGIPVMLGGVNKDLCSWENPITTHKDLSVGVEDTPKYKYLVVDCDRTHTDAASSQAGMAVTNGKFTTYMLMPAGIYTSITLTIYTNNGVYTKKIEDRNTYRENITDGAPDQKGKNEIYLRSNVSTSLSNVEGASTTKFGDVDYLKIDQKATSEKIITKTADLINFINAITAGGSHDVNVISQEQIGQPGEGSADDAAIPAHSVVINKAVMDAIVAKEAVVGDIQLIFKGAKMQIKGGTDAANILALHDLTFNDKAELIEGYAKLTEDVIVPSAQFMDVKGNSNLQVLMNNEYFVELYQINVFAGSTVDVKSDNSIQTINNSGNLLIRESGSVFTANLNNNGTLRNYNGNLKVEKLVNSLGAQLINAGEVNIVTTGTNNGTLNNGNLVNVLGTLTNNATISNNKNGFIFVTSTGTGAFNNGVNGVITNNGRIYTNEGNNTIENLGLIKAMAGSTTYITTNSSADEKVNGTATVKMGTIKIEKRNTDISVTSPNYQGYKEYAVITADLSDGVLAAVKGDKFNKIVLSSATELSSEVANYVNFIETSANVTFPKGDYIQELEFTANAEIYAEIPTNSAERVTVGQLKVNKGVFVKIPTENNLYNKAVTGDTSKTEPKIINHGEILVGGNFYTTLSSTEAKATSDEKAKFTSGHGVSTAWHWNTTWL